MARGVEHMAQIHVTKEAQVECVQHPECIHVRMGDVTIFLWDDDVRKALIAALQEPVNPADFSIWKGPGRVRLADD